MDLILLNGILLEDAKSKISEEELVNAEITWESWLDSKEKLLDGDKSKISIDDV